MSSRPTSSSDANIQPAYLNLKQAAAYLGYAVSTFRAYASSWNIPRMGPRRNRFRKEDLDAWMQNPAVFHGGSTKKRKRSGFTPVQL
ncbi:helix-turn-helix transcriptional regulator [Nitratidesulfovibrio vulgaris]|uniref:helix-turn-helix transcriptional regulator n=1 Tax=Nitratidesulfovibrio vulgaris TaxID=881 RepID=UPI000673E990|nr:helix-turn-helix domain-containing protein [Nitratidesulfovibrio vulgaris]WCB45182.1 helix-turn-helix domain-containing protein [Nitratidesulfovibrio vulgaris]